jgi:hypothetical protein
MTDNELLGQILTELKSITGILQDMRAGSEAQHELSMYKLTSMETIAELSFNYLKSIENNTKKAE